MPKENIAKNDSTLNSIHTNNTSSQLYIQMLTIKTKYQLVKFSYHYKFMYLTSYI